MIVVAGHLVVAAEGRDDYLEGCRSVVEQARQAPGCLDFALSADLVDDRRINVYERWVSHEELNSFRGSGPSGDQQSAIEAADVREMLVQALAGLPQMMSTRLA